MRERRPTNPDHLPFLTDLVAKLPAGTKTVVQRALELQQTDVEAKGGVVSLFPIYFAEGRVGLSELLTYGLDGQARNRNAQCRSRLSRNEQDDRFHFVRDGHQNAHIFPASSLNYRGHFCFARRQSHKPSPLIGRWATHTVANRFGSRFIHELLLRIGWGMVSFGSLYFAIQSYRWIWPSRLPEEISMRTSLESYRSELERQSNYGRNAWLRSGLLFVFLGIAIVFVPVLTLGVRESHSARVLLNAAPFFTLLAIWFVAYRILRRRGQLKLQQEIDELRTYESDAC